MLLKTFRIQNFRSINDSGTIDASRITALLGRNESGKSNILRGLRSLKPAGEFAALNPIKDFPRHRKLTDCRDSTPVVESEWELSVGEQAELVAIWPKAKGAERVKIGRHYGKDTRWVDITVDAAAFNVTEVRTAARKIVPAVKAKAVALEPKAKALLEAAADDFGAKVGVEVGAAKWAAAAKPILASLRQALATANVELTINRINISPGWKNKQTKSQKTRQRMLRRAIGWLPRCPSSCI